jgi:hypothetical protein
MPMPNLAVVAEGALPTVATDSTNRGAYVFVAVLPWAVCPVALEGLDGDAHVLATFRLRDIPATPWDEH